MQRVQEDVNGLGLRPHQKCFFRGLRDSAYKMRGYDSSLDTRRCLIEDYLGLTALATNRRRSAAGKNGRPFAGDGTPRPWRGVRTSRFLYARTEAGPWLLYDLKEDLYEFWTRSTPRCRWITTHFSPQRFQSQP